MTLINPTDTLERQNEKLMTIAASLMRRVEQQTDQSGLAYAQFERAALLEDEVRSRTRDLEKALDLLHDSNLGLEAARAEATRARANLTDAIESITEGFALFDSADTLVLCNAHFCEHFRDIAPRLVPGMSFDAYVDLVSRSEDMHLPAGETAAGWAAMRKSRHARPNAVFNTQLKGDRWLQVSERRTLGQGTVVVQTDVTDIIRLEREERARLKDQQARLIAATLDHLAQGVCIFDDQQRLLGWNRRAGELLRIPLTRIALGARFDALIAQIPRDFALSQPMSRRALLAWAADNDTGAEGRAALRFEIAQDQALVLDCFAQGLPDGGFVISFTDVTSERQAAARLRALNEELEARVAERTSELRTAVAAAERANASKSRFVAAASHDLLQPLSAAKLFLGALDGQQSDPAHQDTLRKATTALGALEGIIDALLDISRLDSGRAVFAQQPVDLAQIFDPLFEQLEPVARAKGVDLRVRGSALKVQSDPAYLRRILQNLLGNAVRYTLSGRVLMGVRRAGRDLRIEVWDTGPGIAPEHGDRIFDEFARLDAPASASEGLGLGLAVVERACAGLGHTLALHSVPGHGTCFSVTLPRARDSAPAPMAEPAPEQSRPGQGKVIFVVENDAGFRRALVLTLEGLGADVIDVASSAEALSLLSELGLRPDGMLVDQSLNGTDTCGTDLVAEIRARFGDIPARVISANRDPALAAQCAQMDASLLTKPFTSEDLAAFLAPLRPLP
ncbi:PAS-domain containing protein [Roseobacteraceae bacterium S113]